jgi:hypothetical protein
MSASTCKPGLFGLERVRYFPRQLITADDMTAEQEYFRQRDRRHNRFLHGWGVVCGLAVEATNDKDHPWRVRVCPGYAIGPQGDEISVADPVYFDVATGASDCEPCQPWPCPPTSNTGGGRQRMPVFLAIRHLECDSRPVRVHPLGCGCDEMLCEYSRVRDDFELKVLSELPQSHRDAIEADKKWQAEFRDWARDGREGPPPLPPCPQCPNDPWVVLASIRLPDKPEDKITAANIGYQGRRVLYSVTALQNMVFAIA